MELKTASVAAALLWSDARLLICQRPADKKRALLWEFPGGKIEEGETPADALQREIREELGADIRILGPVARSEFAYPDLLVNLFFFSAVACGPLRMLEHADMRWILPSEAEQFHFCPADAPVLEMLADGRITPPKTL